MIEKEIKVFVDGLTNYFHTVTKEKASVGTPFLIQDIDEYLKEYTGVISISGTHRGSVFFTAPKPLLKHLLWAMKILDGDESNLKDLVGEISNIISGNAREQFGDQFLLSVPTVMARDSEKKLGEKEVSKLLENYVIPVIWRHLKANLIINLH